MAAQMIFHVICFAFLIVMASTAMFVPVLLYVFNLKAMGWTWEHAALFGAMIASTDAVAVSAILKKGWNLRHLHILSTVSSQSLAGLSTKAKTLLAMHGSRCPHHWRTLDEQLRMAP